MTVKPQNRSGEEMAMRELIVPELRRQYPTARIIHELPLRYSSKRIDLAAVTETEIIAVEIKSSRDVIDRLEGQLRGFYPVTARLIVALAPKWNIQLPMKEVVRDGYTSYIRQFTPTQEIIKRVGLWPGEVWEVDGVAGTIAAEPSMGRWNERAPWGYRLLHMCHVTELVQIANRHQLGGFKRPTHADLVRACHDHLKMGEISRAVCRALRRRDAFCVGTDAPIEEVA